MVRPSLTLRYPVSWYETTTGGYCFCSVSTIHAPLLCTMLVEERGDGA